MKMLVRQHPTLIILFAVLLCGVVQPQPVQAGWRDYVQKGVNAARQIRQAAGDLHNAQYNNEQPGYQAPQAVPQQRSTMPNTMHPAGTSTYYNIDPSTMRIPGRHQNPPAQAETEQPSAPPTPRYQPPAPEPPNYGTQRRAAYRTSSYTEPPPTPDPVAPPSPQFRAHITRPVPMAATRSPVHSSGALSRGSVHPQDPKKQSNAGENEDSTPIVAGTSYDTAWINDVFKRMRSKISAE